MRPFFDQANHLGLVLFDSDFFKALITRGDSVDGCLATLQTNKSPSIVWDANISVFCLVEEACQEREMTGDGPLVVVRVCKMVNVGRRVAIRMEPLRYLINSKSVGA